MFDKKSMFLFISCWLFLAVLFLPSTASAASGLQISDARIGSSDTFPLVENQFSVQQAHLAYLAVKEKVGMQATIRYIAARNGSTCILSALMMKTDTSADTITVAGSDRVLDAELKNLRCFTRSFRGETDLQMHVIHGHADELRAYVQSTVEGSSELQQLLDKY